MCRPMRDGGLAGDHQQMDGARARQEPEEPRKGRRLQRRRHGNQCGAPGQEGLHQEVRRQERVLPQIAALRLREQIRRVDGGERTQRKAQPQQRPGQPGPAGERRQEMERQHRAEAGDDECAPHQPALPLRPREDHVEPGRVLQVPEQQSARDGEEDRRHRGSCPAPHRTAVAQNAGQQQEGCGQIGARRDPLGQRIEAHPPVPRHRVCDVVGEDRRGGGVAGLARMSGDDQPGSGLLLTPHEGSAGGSRGGDRIERRLVRSLVEELRMRLLLGPTDGDRMTACGSRDLGARLVQVADQNRLDGTDHHAGRLQPDVEPVRAEVALLGRVILGVDEDRVVGTGRDAGFAAYADRLVEVDDPVRTAEHGTGRAGRRARSPLALVAARDLECAAGLGKHAHVHVLDVGTSHGERHLVLGLARRGAGMAADAAVMVDQLGPPDLLLGASSRWFGHRSPFHGPGPHPRGVVV